MSVEPVGESESLRLAIDALIELGRQQAESIVTISKALIDTASVANAVHDMIDMSQSTDPAYLEYFSLHDNIELLRSVVSATPDQVDDAKAIAGKPLSVLNTGDVFNAWFRAGLDTTPSEWEPLDNSPI